MCGIVGVVARGEIPSLAASLRALASRGPDMQGHKRWAAENWQFEFGHTRLSIIDLSTAGRQPMTIRDESLVMVFNGEIYNSPELRRVCEAKGHRFRSNMDGEVILHLWEMEGAAALDRLNGIFAVAVASPRTGEVVLARDPLGVKPLFYSLGPDRSLWFASELRALEAAGAPIGTPDLLSLAQFLSFMWVPDPHTPFVGARSLEPGYALRWTPGKVEMFRYGQPLVPSVGEGHDSPEALLESTRSRFSAATRRQLLADVPIGLMASGGVDSGLLWWATHDKLARAYSIDWQGDDDVEGLQDDRRAVGELAARFGTPLVYLPGEQAEEVLPPSRDLFADPAYDLTRLIALTAKEHGYKILLSGQGGDELFGGYRRHSVAGLVGSIRLGPLGGAIEHSMRRFPGHRLSTEYAARLARAGSERDPFRSYMQLCSYSTATERAEALGCTEAEVSDDIVWQCHQGAWDQLPRELSMLRKALTLDLQVYLPGLGLAYVDRAGMEFGVEIRVPWLDLDFVRWTLTVPDEVLVRRGRGKWLTRELAARELSHRIAHRPKRAFAAPVSRVRDADGSAGARGFRQGSYFARARRILGQHLSAPPNPAKASR